MIEDSLKVYGSLTCWAEDVGDERIPWNAFGRCLHFCHAGEDAGGRGPGQNRNCDIEVQANSHADRSQYAFLRCPY
jgi:hypothetical protein